MRGFAALAAAIREEINFESFKGGDMGGDSTALKEACEARGIALSPSLIFAYHDFVLWFIFNLAHQPLILPFSGIVRCESNTRMSNHRGPAFNRVRSLSSNT